MRCFSVITCGSQVYTCAYNSVSRRNIDEEVRTSFSDSDVSPRDLRSLSLHRSLKLVERLFYSNAFQYFVTLTVSPSLGIDRSNYGECRSSVTSALNRFIKCFPGSIYLLVPDYHQDGSYHFHGFFSLSCSVSDALKKAGHFRLFAQGARRTKYYSPLINRLLGRNEFRPLIHCFDDKCLKYVLKYVVKAASLVELQGHSLYIRSRGLVEYTSKEIYTDDDACALEAVFSAFKRDSRHIYDYDVVTWSPMPYDEFAGLYLVVLHSLFDPVPLAAFPVRPSSSVQLGFFDNTSP